MDLPRDERERDPRSKFFPEFKTPTKKDDKKRAYVYSDRTFDTYEAYLEYVTEGMSYNKETNEYGYYRNPNAKYDWYELGGRYSGSLKLKQGETGVFGSPATGREREERTADSCLVSQREKMPLTFAILKDGVWYEKGEVMGFGYVKNPKDDETWSFVI